MRFRDLIFIGMVVGIVYTLAKGHPPLIGESSQIAVAAAADDFSRRFGILPQAIELCSVQAQNGGFLVQLTAPALDKCIEYKADQFGRVEILNG